MISGGRNQGGRVSRLGLAGLNHFRALGLRGFPSCLVPGPGGNGLES